ncbi:hypothetical protein GCM10009749_26310 [Agromyces neolithicus]|uniref:Transposase IS4-like domain-containing protein n=1 Tax=Agromyces neolithicus TaxID=269420 RepID=A0ABN2M939_9MICO
MGTNPTADDRDRGPDRVRGDKANSARAIRGHLRRRGIIAVVYGKTMLKDLSPGSSTPNNCVS